jgi:hypothetical protein
VSCSTDYDISDGFGDAGTSTLVISYSGHYDDGIIYGDTDETHCPDNSHESEWETESPKCAQPESN